MSKATVEVNDWSLVSQHESGPVKQNVIVTGPPALLVNVKYLTAACQWSLLLLASVF